MNHHHRSLCPQEFGSPLREFAKLAEELSIQDETLNTENSLIASGELVLMQTARANIENANNGYRQNAFGLWQSADIYH